jgi:phosphoserine phosphatase RsbU/P
MTSLFPILVADDDAGSRLLLKTMLSRWGYAVTETKDGPEALAALQQPEAPRLAILDWLMPGMDGVEVCRRLHAAGPAHSLYIILLTTRSDKEDIVTGLEAGAEDYIVKPFNREELRVRVKTGTRIITLQTDLQAQVTQLQHALDHIKTLQGILPICTFCKKTRDDGQYLHDLENYIQAHSAAHLSHTVCPDCLRREFGGDPAAILGKTPPAP